MVATEEQYADRCAKRTRAAALFSKSDEFYEDILVGALSAIPRWRYARAIEVKGREPGCARTEDSLQALLGSKKEIIGGRNALCEYLIRRGWADAIVRLSLYSSLMRASLCISEKMIRFRREASASSLVLKNYFIFFTG